MAGASVFNLGPRFKSTVQMHDLKLMFLYNLRISPVSIWRDCKKEWGKDPGGGGGGESGAATKPTRGGHPHGLKLLKGQKLEG